MNIHDYMSRYKCLLWRTEGALFTISVLFLILEIVSLLIVLWVRFFEGLRGVGIGRFVIKSQLNMDRIMNLNKRFFFSLFLWHMILKDITKKTLKSEE